MRHCLTPIALYVTTTGGGEGAMRHRNTGPWIAAGSVFLLLALVATSELLVLTNPSGTHLLPLHSSLSALFRAWH